MIIEVFTVVSVFIALCYLCTPALVIYLTHRFSWADKIGVIILCYVGGLILGNSGLLPEQSSGVQTTLVDLSIVIALPMLLLTLNIRQWSKMSLTALISLVLATLSVVTVSTLVFVFYQAQTAVESSAQAGQLVGMSVAVYTGGSPNLAAIKSALSVPNEVFIQFHSLDTLFGAIYILFMISVAIPLFRKFLTNGAMQSGVNTAPDASQNVASQNVASQNDSSDNDYRDLLKKANLRQLAIIVALTLGIVGVSLGISQAFKQLLSVTNVSAIIIVLISTIAMALSFSEKVRGLKLAYKLGMYLIYVFCFTVASLADIDKLLAFDPVIAVFVFGTAIGSLVLHACLCKLAKVDSETFMITSVSAICSPAFVPMMAKALNNKQILLTGMTTGIIGYALGNYLGISLALLLTSIPG
ncbi:DUF819 family protein [Thalassotalea litorea]|uniref:DUF819 family protein n=1 Tax=Thalassotalea litorea TaxID=2020715 RepID=A0A5R9ITC4_9GAMM|nr:DUF819 family protein [Thalassotalea litorea]TLU67347.1 DUF819 family protein [Thalassotalea litorea]